MSKAGIQTIEITKKQYEDLFLEMNPGYFDRDYVKKVPENEPAPEMFFVFGILTGNAMSNPLMMP